MSMSKVEQLFKHLEARVDEFIELCDEYKRHNRSLQARESQLAEERASLMKKNDMAKAKVEAMISRLKALEQDS
ncbi:MAG: TIGR02449 family protein [Pseudomonadales bacterium]|nr:TIGR02449 family protein [Pseudomonadales bacterium]